MNDDKPWKADPHVHKHHVAIRGRCGNDTCGICNREHGSTADEQQAKWTCPECDAVNRLDIAVVELCVETWQSCSKCGERYAFNLRGRP